MATRSEQPRTIWMHATVAAAALFALVLWPALQSLRDSFGDGESWSLAAWKTLFDPERPAALLALWNSVWTSFASVLLAGIAGTGLALLVARVRFPFRATLAALAVMPLLLPPIIGVFTFKLFLFGDYGLVAQALRAAFGIDFRLNGFAGVLALHAYSFLPFFFLFVAAGQKRIDPALEQSAVSLGAGRVAVLWRVVLPLLTPALIGASVLTLLNSMGSFSAPVFFSPEKEFLTLRIYNGRESDPAGAAALSALLAVASLLLLIPLRRFEGSRAAVSASKGVGQLSDPPFGRVGRALLGAGAATAVLLLLLPHVAILVLSFADDTVAQSSSLPTSFTLAHWASIVRDDGFLTPLRSSAAMAGIAALLDLALGLYVALVLANRKTPFRGAIELVALLPMALPATVLAFNLVRAFGAGSPLTFGHALSGSVALLPLAWFIRHLPIAVRATQSGLATIDPALVDAASSLGAPRVRILARITLPLVAPAILSGGLLCFLSALTEFTAAIMIYVPENLPVSVEIFNRQYNRSLGEPAALSVVLLVAQGIVLLVANRFLKVERAA